MESQAARRGGGAATPWSEVDALFPVGEVIELTDIITGTRYRVRREGGVNHAVVSLLGSTMSWTI